MKKGNQPPAGSGPKEGPQAGWGAKGQPRDPQDAPHPAVGPCGFGLTLEGRRGGVGGKQSKLLPVSAARSPGAASPRCDGEN